MRSAPPSLLEAEGARYEAGNGSTEWAPAQRLPPIPIAAVETSRATRDAAPNLVHGQLDAMLMEPEVRLTDAPQLPELAEHRGDPPVPMDHPPPSADLTQVPADATP